MILLEEETKTGKYTLSLIEKYPIRVFIVRRIYSNFRLENEKKQDDDNERLLYWVSTQWGPLMNMIAKIQNPKDGFSANVNLNDTSVILNRVI